jgi:hypothetical protein
MNYCLLAIPDNFSTQSDEAFLPSHPIRSKICSSYSVAKRSMIEDLVWNGKKKGKAIPATGRGGP